MSGAHYTVHLLQYTYAAVFVVLATVAYDASHLEVAVLPDSA